MVFTGYSIFMYFSVCGIAADVSQFQRHGFTNKEVYQVCISCNKERTRNGAKTCMLFSCLVRCAFLVSVFCVLFETTLEKLLGLV